MPTFRLFILATLVVIGLIAAVAFHSHVPRALAAGDKFPRLALTDIDGKKHSFPQSQCVVMYMTHDAEMGIQLESYSHLQQHNDALPFIAIIYGSEKEVRNLMQETGNPSSIFHDNGVWRDRLGIGNATFKLFVVNDKSDITFATDYATPEDLRQLTDKVLTGQINYPTNLPRFLRKGDSFAAFQVVDIRSNRPMPFEPEPDSSVICFTSHCPDCDLEEMIKKYALSESQNGGKRSSTLLFSSRFSRANLLKSTNRYGIKARLLQAEGSIPGLEDPLSFETFAPAEIVRVDLTRERLVDRISYEDNSKLAGAL